MEKLTPRELAVKLNTLILYRDILDSDVIKSFFAFTAAEKSNAIGYYYEMYSALLKKPMRRVSGNLLTDFVFHTLLNRENAFSVMAIRNFLDEAAYAAMKHDIVILQSLAFFDTWVTGEEKKQNDDNISKLSNAAWGGGATSGGRTSYEKNPQTTLPKLLSLKYGEIELRDAYLADEALEEIYSRLFSGDNWTNYIDDIWNFFASYGSGDFLRYRLFDFDGTRLIPIPYDPLSMPTHSVSLYEKEKHELLTRIMNFLSNNPGDNITLSGAKGSGKTSLILSLFFELPELRLVRAAASASIDGLFSLLRNQPLNFVVFFDDMSAEDIKRLNTALFSGIVQPSNVLIVKASEETNDFAPVSVSLNPPTLNEYTDFIIETLKKRGISVSYAAARNACMDYQVETKRELSYFASNWIIDKLTVGES
ncbi:MAG: DUF815 domain-containing protein [Clostridia bacterium]